MTVIEGQKKEKTNTYMGDMKLSVVDSWIYSKDNESNRPIRCKVMNIIEKAGIDELPDFTRIDVEYCDEDNYCIDMSYGNDKVRVSKTTPQTQLFTLQM